MTRFTKEKGWSEATLFERARGHLLSAETLFQIEDVRMYSHTILSAGYLCHLGIELLLKGCWLFESPYFDDEHKLNIIKGKINFLNFDKNYERILLKIQAFYQMRYPQDLSKVVEFELADREENLREEIGDMDWIDTIKILHEIQGQMPINLADIAKPIFLNFKNTIEERKYLKRGRYLYRRVLDI